MKNYILSGNFYFNIKANSHEEAIEKGWDFIYSNLPECFDVEGAELWCEDESEN